MSSLSACSLQSLIAQEAQLRMPAEWEPHERCWMLWPTSRKNWRRHAVPAQEAFARTALAIARFEPVTVGASAAHLHTAREQLRASLSAVDQEEKGSVSRHLIDVVELESNDIWMRDVGPTFVFRAHERECVRDTHTHSHAHTHTSGTARETARETVREMYAMDWRFNGWGGTTLDIDLDKEVKRNVYTHLSQTHTRTQTHTHVHTHTYTHTSTHTHTHCAGIVETDFVLEGGAVHTDGEGTLLTTEECLLNANRNPHLSREEIEERLRHTLGVQKVLWLPRGLAGDKDTDGHIDNLCCFARPGQVLLAWSDDEHDEQFAICREALAVLQRERDARGRRIDVVKLPIPPRMVRCAEDNEDLEDCPCEKEDLRAEGERLAASYVNFYLPNGGVVAPSFDCESDEVAREILQRVFPEREVVLVPGREILLGGGNIHCITQQQPRLIHDN